MAGGMPGKMGAMVLSATAALRTGCGLLTAHIPKCGLDILQTAVPEAMAQVDTDADVISEIPIDWDPTTLVVGMGMGTASKTADALQTLLQKLDRPIVLDADALNIIAENKKMLDHVPDG